MEADVMNRETKEKALRISTCTGTRKEMLALCCGGLLITFTANVYAQDTKAPNTTKPGTTKSDTIFVYDDGSPMSKMLMEMKRLKLFDRKVTNLELKTTHDGPNEDWGGPKPKPNSGTLPFPFQQPASVVTRDTSCVDQKKATQEYCPAPNSTNYLVLKVASKNSMGNVEIRNGDELLCAASLSGPTFDYSATGETKCGDFKIATGCISVNVAMNPSDHLKVHRDDKGYFCHPAGVEAVLEIWELPPK